MVLCSLIVIGYSTRQPTPAKAQSTYAYFFPIVFVAPTNNGFEECNFSSWEKVGFSASLTITTSAHSGKCSAYYANDSLGTQDIERLAHAPFPVDPGSRWNVSGWVNMVNTGNYGMTSLVVDWFDAQDSLIDEYQVGAMIGAVGWFKLCAQLVIPGRPPECPPMIAPVGAISARPTWVFVKDYRRNLHVYIDDLEFQSVP